MNSGLFFDIKLKNSAHINQKVSIACFIMSHPAPRFKEMRLRIYREFIERAAHELPGVITHLPSVLTGVICEYLVPDEFEHFMLVIGTGLVSGDTADIPSCTITTKILDDHIEFSRFRLRIPSIYAVSNFDRDGFKNRVRLGILACADPFEISNKWTSTEIDRQTSHIARSMYWRFKSAARHLAKELL